MSEKKYSPQEAAIAVLKKTEELYKASKLAKGETGHEKGVHLKSKDYAQGSDAGNKLRTWPKGKGQGYDKSPLVGQITDQAHSEAKESHKKVLGEMKQMPKPKLGKSDDMGSEMPMEMSDKNPDEKADAKLGEKVEREVESHEKTNSDPQHEMPMKGHLKLAKFMGRMEHKKSMKEMDKGETGHEMGINTVSSSALDNKNGGKSQAGNHLGYGLTTAAKDQHRQVLGEMKQMPKPKLPG